MDFIKTYLSEWFYKYKAEIGIFTNVENFYPNFKTHLTSDALPNAFWESHNFKGRGNKNQKIQGFKNM